MRWQLKKERKSIAEAKQQILLYFLCVETMPFTQILQSLFLNTAPPNNISEVMSAEIYQHK